MPEVRGGDERQRPQGSADSALRYRLRRFGRFPLGMTEGYA
jgi:hypothetical protein